MLRCLLAEAREWKIGGVVKDLIHFAHGNGLPSPCYRQLLSALESRYDCCYIDKIGHNAKFPVTENWHFLVDEVLNSVRQQATQPVIAVGHSLGGVLSLLAAIEEPLYLKQLSCWIRLSLGVLNQAWYA